MFIEGLKGWHDGGIVASGRVEEDENESGVEGQDLTPELEDVDDEPDGEYIVGYTDQTKKKISIYS